jgi:hypothetical protein
MEAPRLKILIRIRLRLVPGILLMNAALVSAQVPIVGSGPQGLVRIFSTDSAVLELQDPRDDLPCRVTPIKPALGFDLRLHTGYEVSIPLKELAGPENLLTILFRVTSEDRRDETVYFTQRVLVPLIEPEASGDAYLQGAFDVGEGRYHVDWLMRDRSERVCSHYWDVDTALTSKDREISLALPPGFVGATEFEQFKEEPPVQRVQGEPLLNVKVLLNFAPQNAHSPVLQPLDTGALVSILRGISREPRFGKFSLVAFNLQEQRVICRQENADRIDFPALGEALQSLNLGTVDLKRLSEKHGDTQFLAELIRQEVGLEQRPDALVFAGPKAILEENVARQTLQELGDLDYPVFYMNYNLQPYNNPWRDTIGTAVKFLRGTEFTISRPRDLWFAISEMVSRVVKFRNDREVSNVPGQ